MVKIPPRQENLGNLRIEPWNDPDWSERLSVTGPRAVSKRGMYVLGQLLENCVRLEGHVGEFGVWKGGSAKFMATRLIGSGKTLHLFDTFSGMPKTTVHDNFWREGDWGDTSLGAVANHLEGLDVNFHVGDIVETVRDLDLKFCFSHVDCDLYVPVLKASEYLYRNTTAGGMIVYDDYGYRDCAGAKKAVDDFYSDKPEQPIYIPDGPCLVVKF